MIKNWVEKIQSLLMFRNHEATHESEAEKFNRTGTEREAITTEYHKIIPKTCKSVKQFDKNRGVFYC